MKQCNKTIQGGISKGNKTLSPENQLGKTPLFKTIKFFTFFVVAILRTTLRQRPKHVTHSYERKHVTHNLSSLSESAYVYWKEKQENSNLSKTYHTADLTNTYSHMAGDETDRQTDRKNTCNSPKWNKNNRSTLYLQQQ